MSRTATSRWLRAAAAVSAAAFAGMPAPAAHAAVTPCTSQSGVIAQGYVFTQYVQVRYDRANVAPGGSGLKVCFQYGSSAGGPVPDTYGVIDIPMPTASTALPERDNNHERCREHPWNENLFEGRVPAAGSLRIDYFDGPNWDGICWQVIDNRGAVIYGGRLIIHGTPATVSGTPQVGLVTPAPERDMWSNGGYRAGEPSGDCSNDPGGIELTNFHLNGNQFKLAVSAVNPFGTTSVCARHQVSATGEGVGGKVSVNTQAIPTVAHSRDGTPCTVEHAYFNVREGTAYLWVGSSPLGAQGTQSICVKDSPTSTNRIDITPSATGIVTFTPDSDTP